MAIQLHDVFHEALSLKGDLEMYVVYVLNKDGSPLMPTKRFGHVRRMLKSGQAKAVSTKPFVIQLLYDSTEYTQPLYGGTDPGRTNIGEAVINEKGEVVYEAHVISRNKKIPRLMAKRKAYRQASRRGERLRRKRRAKKCGTTTSFPQGRTLPGYKEGVLALKDIINTEAKFNNRKRPAGWLTPTARQCVQTNVNAVKQILKILPVKYWTLEYNRFAFQNMGDGSIQGIDYQNNKMNRFDNVNDYIDYLQEGRCILCGCNSIEHHHHIIPRHKGGSDGPENIVGLCDDCHTKVHTNKAELDCIGKRKKYVGASIVNIAMPHIFDGLKEIFDKNLYVCKGRNTAKLRSEYGISKEHCSDAVCVASLGGNIPLINVNDSSVFTVVQFRNHDRAIIKTQYERTYKLDGVIIAKNRKPRFEQDKKIPALSDWYKNLCKEVGVSKARALLSKLKVAKSHRGYNNTKRLMNGAIFLYEGKRYILKAYKSRRRYLEAYGQEKLFLAKECVFVQRKSLVYV